MKTTRLAAALLAWAPALAAAPAADPAACAGFSDAQAAALLGAPVAQVKRRVEKISPTLAACAWAIGGKEPALAFSVESYASDKAAADALDRYRDDLSVAGETAPWRGRLPKGAWSDIVGLGGDDAVWTDINGTLMVRLGRLNLQFSLPTDKPGQLKAAQAVMKPR
jgi:hypothetical protein